MRIYARVQDGCSSGSNAPNFGTLSAFWGTFLSPETLDVVITVPACAMASSNGKEGVSANALKLNPRAWGALTPPLSDWILEAVSSMGFDRMTPVQASAIPLFAGNKDVVVEVRESTRIFQINIDTP